MNAEYVSPRKVLEEEHSHRAGMFKKLPPLHRFSSPLTDYTQNCNIYIIFHARYMYHAEYVRTVSHGVEYLRDILACFF